MKLRFAHRQHEAQNIESFFFEPASALDFRAGQYLQYALPHPDPDDRGASRYFTIASAPSEPLVRLTTRLSDSSSSFKHALDAFAPGATLEADGPHGDFVCTDVSAPVVLIAGGIGITPFRAILGDLWARKTRARVTLLYANSSADFAFRAFFDSLAPSWPELRIVYTVSRPSPDWHGATGRIDGELIRQHVPDPPGARYYLCGPTALVDALGATLASLGIDAGRIKQDPFPGYEAAPS